MAHFAEVDESNIVIRVLVVGDDNEHRGQEFLADDLGFGGTWIQTSYNTRRGVHVDPVHRLPDGGTPLRYNYASTGDTYHPDADAFSGPQPYPSWVLDENYVWQPPTPFPDDGNAYDWDEATTSWVKPDSPHPSWVWSDEHGAWQAPTPMPDDGKDYVWDEDTTSWVEVE
jgi:hypothetical protein